MNSGTASQWHHYSSGSESDTLISALPCDAQSPTCFIARKLPINRSKPEVLKNDASQTQLHMKTSAPRDQSNHLTPLYKAIQEKTL